jgi:hypothetical protein
MITFISALLLWSVAATMASDRTTASYPELPVARNYVHVARVATSGLGRKLKLSVKQRRAAFSYIFQRVPVAEFEEMMLTDAAELKGGHTDATLRKTKQYRTALEGCDWVSQRMALLLVSDALQIYDRKFLRPDSLTAPLFAVNSRSETEAKIAGIDHEVSRQEFLESTQSIFPLQSNDKFYYYTTAFGGGYLIARDNKVIKEDEGMFER